MISYEQHIVELAKIKRWVNAAVDEILEEPVYRKFWDAPLGSLEEQELMVPYKKDIEPRLIVLEEKRAILNIMIEFWIAKRDGIVL